MPPYRLPIEDPNEEDKIAQLSPQLQAFRLVSDWKNKGLLGGGGAPSADLPQEEKEKGQRVLEALKSGPMPVGQLYGRQNQILDSLRSSGVDLDKIKQSLQTAATMKSLYTGLADRDPVLHVGPWREGIRYGTPPEVHFKQAEAAENAALAPLHAAQMQQADRKGEFEMLDKYQDNLRSDESARVANDYHRLQKEKGEYELGQERDKNTPGGGTGKALSQIVSKAIDEEIAQKSKYANKWGGAYSADIKGLTELKNSLPNMSYNQIQDAIKQNKELGDRSAKLADQYLAEQRNFMESAKLGASLGDKSFDNRIKEEKFADPVLNLQDVTRKWQQAIGLMRDPEVRTGFGQSTLDKIANWTGTMTPKMAELKSILGDLTKTEIHNVYAGNLSEGEMERSKEWAPGVNDTIEFALNKSNRLMLNNIAALSKAVRNHHYVKYGGNYRQQNIQDLLDYNPYGEPLQTAPNVKINASTTKRGGGNIQRQEDQKIREYADQHLGGDYEKAKKLLINRGYHAEE